MSYCQNCGAEVTESTQYCQSCGHDLRKTSNRESTPRSGAATDTSQAEDSETNGYTTGQKVIFGGTAVVVLGAFLPWISVNVLGTSLTKRGIQADGTITLLVALISGAAALFSWNKIGKVVSVLAGLLISGIALIYISNPLAGTGVSSEFAQYAVSIGIGLYLTAIGGFLHILGPILDRR